jgi:5'-3' exonuclease
MGIHNLYKFLKNNVPQVYCNKTIRDLDGKTIAIDMNLYLYKFKHLFKDKWMDHLSEFIANFQRNNITCMCIYDTQSCVEKTAKKKERRMKKKSAEHRIKNLQTSVDNYTKTHQYDENLLYLQKKYKYKCTDILDIVSKELICLQNKTIQITKADIQRSKDTLTALGVAHYQSLNEAETHCSILNRQQLVDAVLSNDTDVLAYGAPTLLTKIDFINNHVISIEYADILAALDITAEMFTDFCILCGTDYNYTLNKMTSDLAFRLIKTHKSLEAIESECDNIAVHTIAYTRIREIFNPSDEYVTTECNKIKQDY